MDSLEFSIYRIHHLHVETVLLSRIQPGFILFPFHSFIHCTIVLAKTPRVLSNRNDKSRYHCFLPDIQGKYPVFHQLNIISAVIFFIYAHFHVKEISINTWFEGFYHERVLAVVKYSWPLNNAGVRGAVPRQSKIYI